MKRWLPAVLSGLMLTLFGIAARPAPADARAGVLAVAAVAPAQKRYQTTLSFTPSRDGQALVPVRINASLTGIFLVDTGSSKSCITDALAAKLGLRPVSAVGSDGKPMLLGDKRAQMVTVATLQIGTFRVLDSHYLIVSQRTLSDLIGQRVDGIIGADVPRQYPMLLDFSQRHLTLFYPSPLTDEEMKGAGMDDAVSVPVVDPEGRFIFTAKANLANNDRRAEDSLLIDTGSAITMISGSAAQQLQLKAASENRNYPTLFGPLVIERTILPDLSLGNVHLENLWVRYAPEARFFYPPHLGVDFLSHFRMLLDFKQRVIYLKPVSPLALPTSSQTKPPVGP